MEELLNILKEISPDVDFENEENLVEDGLIDSFDIVRIVAAINDEFDIEFNVKDVIPENFNSAKSLYAAIKRMEEE